MTKDLELLERGRELAAIDAALDAAVAGGGGALAVEGEAGLGKTRLLAEASRRATDAGVEVLSGRATELERDFPFAMLRQLLEPPLRAIPAAERESLFEGAIAARGALGFGVAEARSSDAFSVLHALYWVVAGLAERSPLLLVADDVHLADPGSLDWLAFMLPRLDELPVFLMLARRTGEAASPELARVLGDPSVEAIVPAPLSSEASATLIERAVKREPDPSFAAVCHEITGGNPFLVTELARELADQGIEPQSDQGESARVLAPQRVSQMTLARVARLTPAAGKLARSVAILGDGGEPALAVELAGLDPETGREAADSLRRAAIFASGEVLRFVHPLVRNAVYADLATGERGTAHAAAAEMLRDRGAAPESVATQVLASEARGDRLAVESLLEAARRCLADGAARSAVAYLTRALREPPPADLRTEVLKTLLEASTRAADHAALAAVEPELRSVLEREPASARGLVVPLTIGMVLGGRFVEAADVLQAAIAAAVADGDVESAFRFEAQLRTIAVIVPSVPEVDLQKYIGEVEPDSSAGRLAAAIEARHAAVNVGAAKDAVEAAERALGNDGVIFEEEPDFAASAMAVMTLIAGDAVDGARRASDRALEIARARDAAPDLSRAWVLSGMTAWAEGDLTTAEADLQQAMELARLAGLPPLLLLCGGPLGVVMIERDDLEAAEAILVETGTASGPIPENALFSLPLALRARLRFERGEFSDSLEDCETLLRQADRFGFGPGPTIVVSPYASRALVVAGRADEARELANFCLPYARRWGAPGTISLALRALAAARGGAEEIELLEEAASVLADSPRRIQRIDALVDLGAALRRQNRRADAREPLRAGLALARQCGAVRAAGRARDELLATGETVRNYAPIGVESLTPSERRAAEMAATGMTNRQIAQSLFVTVKTVEAHLSAAYDKLDISSRNQLKAALSS